jgi:copper chaperone CopZ
MIKALRILIALQVLSAGIAKAQFTKAELQINGVNCALCAKATQNSMKALPFVSNVKPDLMRNLFVITFKKDVPVNFDELGKIMRDGGFFITSLKVTLDFDKLKVEGDSFNYCGDTYRVMNGAAKPLNGEVVVTIVDKGFAPRSVSKKYQLVDAGPAKSGRVYHVAI